MKYILWATYFLYFGIVISACTSNESETIQENTGTPVVKAELSPAAIKGKKIFIANCSACHLMSNQQLVGPGMVGVTEKYDKKWLIRFITNSQKMIAEGDEKALAIYKEYNQTVMTSFSLKEDEFDNLLAYLKEGGE
jgi:cytochrome c2